jgi:hypothetical protein
MNNETKNSINTLIDEMLNQYEKTGDVPLVEDLYKSVVKESELNISIMSSSEIESGKISEFKPSFIK